jgi:recombinational DNA repair protein RecR
VHTYTKLIIHTQEEVVNGILANQNRDEQSICIFRNIKDIENMPMDDKIRRNYVDMLSAPGRDGKPGKEEEV